MAVFIPRKPATALIHKACGKNLRGNSELGNTLIPLLLEKASGVRRAKAEGILRSREGKGGGSISPIQVRSRSMDRRVNV